MEKSKNNYYIDKKKFQNEIVKYKLECESSEREGKEKPRLSNYLGKCIYDIVVHTSRRPNFIRYSFREEMIGDAIETALKYFDKYDINNPKQNPFGYFTKIAWQSFVQRIELEEKNRYIIYKNFENNIIYGGQGDLLQSDESGLQIDDMYDNISESIQSYEKKMEEKKRIRIEKKKEKERLREVENEKRSDNSSSIGEAD